MIRTKLSTQRQQNSEKISATESDLKTRFWSTCHRLFANAGNSKPEFTVAQGFQYFVNTLSQANKLKKFLPPSWMPTLPLPADNMDIRPPTYKDVTDAVNKCRPEASACPLDQLSILILKHCPILRTLLHKFIAECWAKRTIPECWKKESSILIYKKGDPTDPSNFRPIT